MFVLGYALGFYDVNELVPVLESSGSEEKGQNRRFIFKHIYSLCNDDIVSGSLNLATPSAALPRLFGYTSLPNFFGMRMDAVSVEVAQQSWIQHFKSFMIPEFPNSYSSGESNIRLSDALFCFVGNTLHGAQNGRGCLAGARPLQNCKYSILPLGSMGLAACRRLTGKYGLSIFEKYRFAPEHNLKPHSLRHFSNTLAARSDIPVEVITAWSGRIDPEQTHTYIHTSHQERADAVSAILNPPNENKRALRLISRSDLTNAKNIPASVTSTGVCMQDLNVTPCDYLNDFVSQCFKCSQACYVAGDEDAIKLLSKDLACQTARLESAKIDLRLHTSQAMQRWYIVHSQNTFILRQLILLLTNEVKGALITYVHQSQDFAINSLKENSVRRIPCSPPSFELELQQVLSLECLPLIAEPNPELGMLLRSFGIVEEGKSSDNS
jgi:hypothetical protein